MKGAFLAISLLSQVATSTPAVSEKECILRSEFYDNISIVLSKQKDDIEQHILALEGLEKKLKKRIRKTNILYTKVAALRIDGDWDENWLRTEIDNLMISHRNNFLYDNPEKEIVDKENHETKISKNTESK